MAEETIESQLVRALYALKQQGISPMYGKYYKATIYRDHERRLVEEIATHATSSKMGKEMLEWFVDAPNYIEPGERLVAVLMGELLVVCVDEEKDRQKDAVLKLRKALRGLQVAATLVADEIEPDDPNMARRLRDACQAAERETL